MVGKVTTLKEMIKIEDKRAIVKNLKKISKQFIKITSWMEGSTEFKTSGLFRSKYLIAKSAIDFVDITINNIDSHVSILALCTRNIYELNLRINHISENDENLKKWLAESIQDEIDIYEGILQLERVHNKHDHIVQNEISRLKSLADKHSLELKKFSSTGSIASDLNERNEYNAVFKLFSKLVHPTSYLVNKKQSTETLATFNFLIVHNQLYSQMILQTLHESTKCPEEIKSS